MPSYPQINSTDPLDIAIIGGGVLGIALAFHLRNSKLKIAVLEKEQAVAQHASGRNAGMVRQLYRNPFLSDWAKRSIAMYPSDIREKCFKQTGSLILGRCIPEHHRGLFEQKLVSLRSGKFPAVYTQTDGLLDSGTYVEGLKFHSRDTVRFVLNTKIEKCIPEGSFFKLISSNQQELRAKIVVNATGAWFNSALPDSHPGFAVNAYRRHLMVSRGLQQGDVLNQNDPINQSLPDFGYYWDEKFAWYMRNWGKVGEGADAEMEHLISACEKVPVEPDSKDVPISIEHELSEKLRKTYPEMYRNLRIGRSWYCFRTYNKQELPIWGKDPYTSNLYHLGAFGGFGMSTSLAATFDLAELILGKKVNQYDDFKPRLSMNDMSDSSRVEKLSNAD